MSKDENGRPLTYWGGLAEPKQELEKELFELEQELDIPSSMRWHNSKPNQETLEEADYEKLKQSLIEFRKVPMTFVPDERRYSEEEVIDLLVELNSWPTTFEGKEDITDWFEQFKNK
jgi:hypothetical protein